MANYETFELSRTWVCFEVPAPSQIEDFCKALRGAELSYRKHYNLPDNASLSGDWCEIHALDDRLRIQFEIEAVKR